MKETYVIEGVSNGGFWSNGHMAFRGILFASHYESEDCQKILGDLTFATHSCMCKITKLYYRK